VIPLKDQEYIKQRFSQELEGKVKIDFFTQRASKLIVPGRAECPTCDEAGKLVNELAALSERVLLTTHEFSDAREEAQKLGVDKVPAFVLRGPANRPVRFFGVPGGNEFPNFIETIIDLSKKQVVLPVETARQLKKIKDKSTIDVFVTPTCPHCPGVVRASRSPRPRLESFRSLRNSSVFAPFHSSLSTEKPRSPGPLMRPAWSRQFSTKCPEPPVQLRHQAARLRRRDLLLAPRLAVRHQLVPAD
jgi:glutaredoxin